MSRIGSGRHLDYNVHERCRLGYLPVETCRRRRGRHPRDVDDEVPDGAEAGIRRGVCEIRGQSIVKVRLQVVLVNVPLCAITSRNIRISIWR